MDFLADENFPLDAVERLEAAGHGVVAIVHVSPGISDEQVLERAARDGRVILTFARDYWELLYGPSSNAPTCPGIIYFRFDPSPPEEPALYLLALLEQPGWSPAGKLTVVERDRARQRPLP